MELEKWEEDVSWEGTNSDDKQIDRVGGRADCRRRGAILKTKEEEEEKKTAAAEATAEPEGCHGPVFAFRVADKVK